MNNKESQAGTKAEQRKNDEVLTSSPACTKPTVVCMCHHKPSIEFDVDKTSNQILKGFNGLSMPQAMSVIKLLIILIKQNCQVSLSEDVLAGQENHIDNL